MEDDCVKTSIMVHCMDNPTDTGRVTELEMMEGEEYNYRFKISISCGLAKRDVPITEDILLFPFLFQYGLPCSCEWVRFLKPFSFCVAHGCSSSKPLSITNIFFIFPFLKIGILRIFMQKVEGYMFDNCS